MKILIIVKSKHCDNTLKIAEAMSEAGPVTMTQLENADNYNLNEYDIVGFGSGIYYGKHDKQLVKFVEGLDDGIGYTFVFSTSGSKSFEKHNRSLVKLLESKNKVVLGSFGCLGLDKFFIFALGGGMNKGRPNEEDFDAAQRFIAEIIARYETVKSAS